MTKKTPLDKAKIQEAYQKKYEEYNKYTPEELKEIFELSKTDKKKRIGGTHRMAFLAVLETKLKDRMLKEAIDNSETIETTKD